MIKYYVMDIMERTGDKEHVEKFLLSTDIEIEKAVKEIWLNWYEEYEGDSEIDYLDEKKNCYWNYESLVYEPSHCEITFEKFEVLKEFLTLITKMKGNTYE